MKILQRIILLIILLGIMSCSNTKFLQKELNYTTPSLSNSASSCPAGIIPERLFLQCDTTETFEARKTFGGHCYQFSRDMQMHSRWNDSTKVFDDSGGSACHLGYKEGENLSHIYCTNLIYQKSPIENEIVQKEIKSTIDLELDGKDNSRGYFKVIKSSCSQFFVVKKYQTNLLIVNYSYIITFKNSSFLKQL